MAPSSLERRARSLFQLPLLALIAAASVAACTDRRADIPVIIPDGFTGVDGRDGLGGGDAPDVPPFVVPDGGGADAPPCNMQVSCSGPGYKYCGRIGDGVSAWRTSASWCSWMAAFIRGSKLVGRTAVC